MPNTNQFNQSEFNQWPAQPATLTVSDDPDFLEGLFHRCAVEYDANADGATTDDDGDRDEDWHQVEGLEDVACRVVIRGPKDVQIGDRPSATMEWTVLFGQTIIADRRNRIIFMDPDAQSPRHGYLQGRVENAHGMNHHWVCKCVEYPI